MFSVVLGTSHYMDPEEEWAVHGFATQCEAQEYARRFIRAQVEQHRHAAPADTIRHYHHFGDYAAAEGLDSTAWVAFCADNPATHPDETDHAALEPNRTLP